MPKQTDFDMIVDTSIVAIGAQLVDGTISVTDFVLHCMRHKWVVSSINIVTGIITICHDTKLNDDDGIAIIIWKDIDTNTIAR